MFPTYWCHELALSGSRNVSRHVTIWFPRCHFLQVLYCNRVSISNHFRDNAHFSYLGHDLDLSGSRDVIGHVTIWFPRCHFLLVLYCNRVSISNHFRDNGHFHIWVTTLTFLGHVTSSFTWPFDSPGAISYRCSIVTESLSPTIFEIMGILSYLGHDLDLSRSRDVIGHVTIWFPRCHFL